MEHEYKKDLIVNFFKLDEDWLNQPLLYMHYGELHANAVAKRDRLAQRRKVVRAEVSLKVREHPSDYNLDKATDSSVDACVRMSDEYQEVTKEWLDTCEEVDILDTAKWAFQQRKDVLAGLTQLYVSGYFSSPKLPKEMKEGMTERMQELLEFDQNKALEQSSENNERLSRLKK